MSPRTMPTLAVLVCLGVSMSAPANAQKAGNLGAGVVLGNPSGATAKYWVSGTQAVDAGLGYSTDLAVYADYLWHSWTLLPQPQSGRLAGYVGLGGQIRALSSTEFGVRAAAGVSYWMPKDPVECFVELVPVFRLTPGASVGLDGGLGLRYYFGSVYVSKLD